jgi:MoxR-like ATPase
MEPFEAELAQAKNDAVRLRSALASVVLGQDEVIEQVLWALVAGGHVLLEGNPGLGKTLLVRTLASCLKLKFSRIQFTPDLMPSDITGTNVLVPGAEASRRFELHKGPIFGQVVLADEINRATPKTQSALLEAMQEHAVTIGGVRHVLDEPFFVLATENPIEMEGTYPLPEAQLDRFLVKVLVSSPDEEQLSRIISATTGRAAPDPAPVLEAGEVMRLRSLCRDVVVSDPVVIYAARLVTASSPEAENATPLVRRAVRYGAGVRGAQALVLVAKALALLDGRAHAGFADVQRAAKPVLRHRILRSFEGEADRISQDRVIDELLAAIPTLPERVERAVKGG